MNARVTVPHQPSDFELERDALGIALLGYPLPDWLDRSDFFGPLHRAIFDAARELGSAASLPTIAALLRDQGKLLQLAPDRWSAPGKVSSAELFEMMDAAAHAMSCGWAVDFDRLRELRKQRELLAAMARAKVLLECEGSWCEATEILKEAM